MVKIKKKKIESFKTQKTKNIKIIKTQQKKENGSDSPQKKKWAGLEMLWENWEAWDLDWCEKSKSDVASVGEDKKKSLSFNY